jgi:eukaryotic-like serine/threonine-protein kinase
MPFKPGTKLGPYEILSAVETAKAGDLYKASDTRLKREVAIKVFDRQFSDSFVREARAIGSLNHPNICALHDIGHEEGADFLVMEFLEGETLARRLEKGPLNLDEAITVAIAIGDALDKMHREGVTHRALRPSKVMLTPAGPKLLGIRLAEPKPTPDASLSPKSLLPVSDTDLQYTPPECLDGKDPDARSDIFAYGAIVYEMIAGQKAFEGKSRAVLIASIATADPDPLSKTRPDAPPMLQHIIQRCLAKDPEDRWQTAHDLLVQLRWVAEGGGAPISAPVRKREKRIRVALALAAVLILALAYPAARYWLGSTEPGPFQFRVPIRGLRQDFPSISPDGATIALVARPNTGEPAALYIRRTDSVTFTKLAGTDDASQPFWSPDSRSIGFVVGNRLKQVSVSGGAPKDIGEAQGFSGGAWNREGIILFGSATGVYRISAEGGKSAAVTTLDAQETGHFWPNFLPDGQHFLYLAWSGQAANRALFVGKLDSKDKTRLMAAESNAAYAAPGYIVFHRESSVFAQPFDPKKLEFSGKPVHIADEVVYRSANGCGVFGVSQTGALLYFQGLGAPAGRGNIVQNVQWGWVDRTGRPLGLAGESGPYGDMDLSPDGKLIAVTKQDTGSPGADIWVIDWQRAGVVSRLTMDPADDINPVWAPDGKHIAFTSYRKGNADIYVIENGSGVGKEIPLLESPNDEIVEDWSKDGKYIAYLTGQDNFKDIYALPLADGKPDADKKPFPVVQGHFQKDEPQFSYDGKLLAYTSDRTVPGTFQVYVRTFPAGDQEIPITVAGGGQPRWKKDGKELYYRAPDDSIMAVEIKAGARLEAGIPHQLIPFPMRGTQNRNPIRHVLSASPDGQRFLLRVPPSSGGAGGGGNAAVPEVPALATPSGLPMGALIGTLTNLSPISNGLTVIQHWPSALGKAEK